MSTDIRIVPLEEKHIAACSEMEQICFSMPWSEKALRTLLQEPFGGVAAETAGHLCVGYGGIMCVADEGDIINIAVHPDYRRLGIGRGLVRALKAQARSKGVVKLNLEVRRSNQAAQTLYLSEGFTVVGTSPNAYKLPTEDAILMQMTLSPV